MKAKNLMRIAAIMAGISLLGSCTMDPYVITAKEEYTRNFIKSFGLIDPAQDWNMAQASSLTVNTGDTPADVKLYALVSGKYYLVADLKQISGSVDIPVDIPKGVTDMLVKANGKTFKAAPGGNVDINAPQSRTFGDEVGSGSSQPFTFSVTSDKREFPVRAISDFITAVPEEEFNIGKSVDYQGEQIPLSSNFYFVGTGEPLTFYPLYWNTSSYHALGVYWLDEEGNFSASNMHDLYYTRSGELEVVKGHHKEWEEDKFSYCYYNSNEGEICKNDNLVTHVVKEGETVMDPWGNQLAVGQKYHIETIVHEPDPDAKFEAVSSGSNPSDAYPINKVSYIRSKGITVTFDKGVRYGFYIKVSQNNSINPERPMPDGPISWVTENDIEKYTDAEGNVFYNDRIDHIVFSQARRNKEYGTDICPDIYGVKNQKSNITDREWNIPEGGYENDKYVQASFTTLIDDDTDKKYSFFAFEDWKLNGPDLNDLVFIIDDSVTKPNIVDEDRPQPEPEVTEETISWLVAAEDLGVVDDFDFNDVIFTVTSVTTNKGDQVDAYGSTVISKKVTVQALAAGGTLETYLHFHNGTTDYVLGPDGYAQSGSKDMEWHQWFDRSAASEMINTGRQSVAKPASIDISDIVPADFSMAEYCKVDANGRMYGFYISVNGWDTMENVGGTSVSDEGEVKFITSAEPGSAPQMFVIPDIGHKEGEGWYWPTERTHIMNAYTGFSTWVNYADAGAGWYKNTPSGRTMRINP